MNMKIDKIEIGSGYHWEIYGTKLTPGRTAPAFEDKR